MSKDWTGNKKTTFVQLGASNHSDTEREENDFYSTDPESLKLFLQHYTALHQNIYEPACGMGHLSKFLKSVGYNVFSTDLVDRGYGDETGVDFLTVYELPFDGNCDILTNPPYKFAQEFVEHSMDILKPGFQCIMFLKIQFLEGQSRQRLFKKYPPKYVYVNSTRQTCYLNGNMDKKMSSASCYCWFVFEKGFTGDPVIKWL